MIKENISDIFKWCDQSETMLLKKMDEVLDMLNSSNTKITSKMAQTFNKTSKILEEIDALRLDAAKIL